MGRLDGKDILITGGTMGIGFACAKLFRLEGARIAITGRSEANLTAARDALGEDVLTICADASRVSDIETMTEAVSDRVRFFAYHRIKPHAPPLVRAPVNSFEFQPCGRTPQAGHLMR